MDTTRKKEVGTIKDNMAGDIIGRARRDGTLMESTPQRVIVALRATGDVEDNQVIQINVFCCNSDMSRMGH